jgi:YrbI family 3-deoxy-D-manno-octulosonate 8-phosphate phosphatase
VETDGSARSFNYDHLNRPRRQDAPEDLIENGSIYIFKPWVLRQLNNRLGGKIAVYRMPALNSFQIDEPADLELIEALLAFRNTEQTAEGRKQKTESVKRELVSAQSEHQDSQHSSSPTSVCNRQPPASDLRKIKLLVLDFDGVLTDNRVLVQEDGTESVYCDRGDGFGIGMLKTTGVEVVVISKEKNPVVAARCRKLGVECLQGCDDKLQALQLKTENRKLKVADIAYVGNDLNDLECLRWVGLPIAVADAIPDAKAAARWVTLKAGGRGAVREVCDALVGSRRGSLIPPAT